MMDKQHGGSDDFELSDLDELADLEGLEEFEPLDELPDLPELPDHVDALPALPDEAVLHAEPTAAPSRPAPAPRSEPVAARPKPPVAPVPAPAKQAKAPVERPAPIAKAAAPVAPVPSAPVRVPDAAPTPAAPADDAALAAAPAVLAGGAAASSVPAADAGDPASADPGGKRELERAPLLLRKAAIFVAAGSLLPWSSQDAIDAGTLTWGGSLAAKALLLIAIGIVYQSHIATHGGKVFGALAGIGKLSIPFGKQAKLNALVPLALVFALVGLFPLEGQFLFKSLSEKLILLLAGYTFAHIYDYEHGGRFNPIYPLMFLAPAIGGLGAIFLPVGVVGKLGAAAVAFGGGLACYTLGMAMAQAKKEGDAKRVAVREARKAARASSGRGGRGKTDAGRPGGRGPAA